MNRPQQYEKVVQAYCWMLAEKIRMSLVSDEDLYSEARHRSGLDHKTFDEIWPHVAPGGGVNLR